MALTSDQNTNTTLQLASLITPKPYYQPGGLTFPLTFNINPEFRGQGENSTEVEGEDEAEEGLLDKSIDKEKVGI